MREYYQRGYLRCVQRKQRPATWEFRWREIDAKGKVVRRTALIGTIEQFPTQELADAAVRKRHKALLIKDLIDHYILTELSDTATWHSHSTKIVYKAYLERWIRQSWGGFSILDVRTVAVEEWLRHLNRVDGKPLANSTKAKIRNLMSVLFNHAVRYEWLAQGKNPVTLVRQSAQRKNTPAVLEPGQVQSLLTILESPYRLMALLAATTGLRRSELFALKWQDVDNASLTLQIRRSIYGHVVGNCKTPLPGKICHCHLT
jgi:integrase